MLTSSLNKFYLLLLTLGKPFSSVCQVIIDMKKDIDYSNQKMNARFKDITKMFQTLKEGNGKSFVDSEIEALSKVLMIFCIWFNLFWFW